MTQKTGILSTRTGTAVLGTAILLTAKASTEDIRRDTASSAIMAEGGNGLLRQSAAIL
jgi:hypothetical protein